MPGLRLTPAQACRLWQLDLATCEELFDHLLREGFLSRTGSGFYVADTGIIVTNAHVVGPMLSMSVQRFDRSKRVRLIGDSANLDPPESERAGGARRVRGTHQR